ncbi:MAG: M20/M25/M40 family metallo-hydrolase [Candidatus Heimdallarchaeota archaeon]|nr:M20/M25/M40 family metallo-hydrolase [Candidatus Heimdallarchaeota archaeon]
MSDISKKELIDLLEKLVSYNTVNIPTQNIKVPKACPEFIVTYLKEKGIEAKLFEDEGYYSVYGKIGEGDFHLLLMAHFDVVPVSDGWETDPFEMVIKEGNKAFGRGVIDNKNNVASIMTILPIIKSLNLGKEMTICFELSGDEEIGGVYSAGNYLKKFDRMPNAVMNLDGAGEVIISRRRNAMGATIRIPKEKAKIMGEIQEKKFTTEQWGRHTAYQHRGADVHCLIKTSVDVTYNNWKVSSCQGKFIKGNVVPDECTVKIIQPLDEGTGKEYEFDVGLTALLENLQYLVNTQFKTGFSTYGITIGPNLLFEREDHWELGLDIRAMTQDYEEVEKALRIMCDELFEENRYLLEFKPGQGMVNTARDTMLISTVLEVLKEMYLPSKVVEMGGASDARYFSREGIPTFDFGPIGGGVHANNEWLNLDSFERVTRLYLEIVKSIHEKVSKK